MIEKLHSHPLIISVFIFNIGGTDFLVCDKDKTKQNVCETCNVINVKSILQSVLQIVDVRRSY